MLVTYCFHIDICMPYTCPRYAAVLCWRVRYFSVYGRPDLRLSNFGAVRRTEAVNVARDVIIE